MNFKSSIVAWLVSLVLLPVIPLFCFALYSIEHYAHERQLAVEAELAQRTEAIAHLLQNRLEKTLGYLSSLAISDAGRQGDVPALYHAAARIQENNSDITNITLIDPAGNLVFLTSRPLGTHFPVGQSNAVRQVFETKRPVLSEPFQSPIANRKVVALGIPVIQDGKVIYCIRAILTTNSINDILKQNPLPANWIAGAFSSRGITVGRSQALEYIGQESPNILKAILEHRVAAWDATTKEGVLTRTVIRPVGSWEWFVAVGAPSEILTAPLRSELLHLTGLGLLLLCLSVFAVVWMSRQITQGLKETVDVAGAVLTGAPVTPNSTAILEIDQMRESLTAVDLRSKWLEQRVTERTADLTEARARLSRFVAEQERVVEAERLRISREVHDQIGSVLTGLKMIFRSLPPGSLPSPQEAAFVEALDQGVATARRIAAELRPPLIDDLGLQAAVRHLLENMFRGSSVAYSVQFEDLQVLTERQIIGTYRILQEACTNVARHAQASKLEITGMATDNDQYLISLCDDGIGLPSSELRHGGLGLMGMRERAQLLGGSLVLGEQNEGGTCLTLWLPLAPTEPPCTP